VLFHGIDEVSFFKAPGVLTLDEDMQNVILASTKGSTDSCTVLLRRAKIMDADILKELDIEHPRLVALSEDDRPRCIIIFDGVKKEVHSILVKDEDTRKLIVQGLLIYSKCDRIVSARRNSKEAIEAIEAIA